jgi:iron complex outermembrane receptor protein
MQEGLMRALRGRAATRRWLLKSCVALVALSGANQALAADDAEQAGQQVSDQPADTADATEGLQVITVTAQRRSEDVQKVPIVVNTLTSEELEQRAVDGIAQIAAAVPNVAVTGSFNSNVYIRGVGANSASSNNEPSAAVYVDGVYIPSNLALRAFALNHVERLEVLKGPQGTLFGRNATAGVIQFITPDPKHTFAADMSLGYASYSTVTADLYFTGGITDDLAADLAVVYEKQNDGWGYNPTFKQDIWLHSNIAARSKWLFTPTDTTRVLVTVDGASYRSDGGNNALVPGSLGIDKVTTFAGRFRAVGTPNIANDDQYGGSVRIDQDLGGVHLASISAYRNVTGHWRADNDLGPSVLVQVDNFNNADYYSEELQLSNRNPGWLTWVAGVFLYGNKVYGANPQANQGSRVTGGYRGMYGVQKTRSGSVFAQATAEVLPGTKITAGIRYTDEKLEANGKTLNSAGGIVAGPFTSEVSYNPWTWRIALDQEIARGFLLYASYNRGFKSGGYNLSSPGTAPFLPETLDAYEAGFKSTFFDNRVRLNVGGFYYDYKNLQVAIVPGGGSQIFTNAAKAENYGLDASLEFAATNRLDFSADLGLLHAKYKDYPNAQGFTILGVAFPIANAAGRTLPYSPSVSADAAVSYRLPMTAGDLKASASVGYVGKTYVTPDQGLVRPAYTLVNASLGWDSHSWWGVRVFARNLFDDYYYTTGIESANGWYITPGAPRTIGVEFQGHW